VVDLRPSVQEHPSIIGFKLRLVQSKGGSRSTPKAGRYVELIIGITSLMRRLRSCTHAWKLERLFAPASRIPPSLMRAAIQKGHLSA